MWVWGSGEVRIEIGPRIEIWREKVACMENEDGEGTADRQRGNSNSQQRKMGG